MRPFILRSLSRYAEKMGHEVAGVALDGAEAVERIYEVQPDMVLLDLNMPEKDGIAVIREACLDRMIPVIIITGHYSELLMNRADIPCVYGCLMRPTSEAQVQAAIAPWMRATCLSPRSRVVSCMPSARPRSTSTASTSRRTRRSPVVSRPLW